MIKTSDKKKKYYILMILSIAVLAILVLPNLIVSSINKISEASAQKLELDPSKLTPVEEVNSILETFPDGDTEVRIFKFTRRHSRSARKSTILY